MTGISVFDRQILLRLGMASVLSFNVGCLGVGEEVASQAIVSPTPAPVVFTGFSGIKQVDTLGATKLGVSWDVGSDPKIVYYNVYDTTVALKPKLIKQVRHPSNSAVLTNLKSQGYYLLRVVAADADGNEDGNANDKPGIPYGGSGLAVIQTSSTAILNFSDGSEADSINIYCKKGDGAYQTAAAISNVALTSTVLTGLLPGVQYTCRAALVIAGFEDNNQTTTQFTPMGSASKLLFTANPGSAAAGDNLGVQPIVTIMDANNNIVTAGPDSTVSISLSISAKSPTVGVIRGNPTVAAVAGVATFKAISFQEIGSKILTATKADTSAQKFGSLSVSVDSKNFVITGAPVDATKSKIAVSADPPLVAPLVANGTAAYTVTLTLLDKFGNAISGVKPQFGSSNPLDSVTQPTKPTNADGTTTGSFTATAAGTRTLSIISPSGLSAANTTAVYVPGPATKVAFLSQPVNSPSGPAAMNNIKVAIQDSQGNTVTTSAANVTLSIFTNPGNGVLSGSATVPAVNGVAAFSGLGIDKTGTGYKLVANSAPLSVAYSNSFNMLAGVPAKLIISGPQDLTSGVCSTAYTIQLQDWAGNPANASANTPVLISGTGSGGFFSSGSCAGVPIAGTLNFASGSNIKTLYFKDSKGESLTVTATDPSSVMSAGTLAVRVAPSQISITAPATVISGTCSGSLDITTLGANNDPAPVFAATTVLMSGLFGTQGQIFATSDCSGTALNPNAIPLTVGQSTTKVYLKDSKAEMLILNILDPNSILNTISGNQSMNVLPSKIVLTGPTVAVSGRCSPVFVVTIKDAANNAVNSVGDTVLSIAGLTGTQGGFYANNSCSTPIGNNVLVPNGNSFANIYFSDLTAEVVNIKVTDPNTVLADSQTIAVTVSPSNFAWTGPASVKTSVCTSAITLKTTDANGGTAAAVTPIVANLSGAGAGGKFYSDVGCTAPVTTFTFAQGESTKTLYFSSVTPAVTPALSLTATDPAAVVTAGVLNFTVNPAPAWIGGGGKLGWFTKGIPPTYPRYDAVLNGVGTGNMNSSMRAKFDATKTFLYVVDTQLHKILKYDYVNKTFVGWIGQYASQIVGNESILISGSTISGFDATCASLPTGNATPAWCLGGNSAAAPYFQYSGPYFGIRMSGGLYNPFDVVSDGTYLYVANQAGFITKYKESTGEFIGWIGRTMPTPYGPTGQAQAQFPNTCSSTANFAPTPGWCVGGWALSNLGGGYNGYYNNYVYTADGGMWAPYSIAYAAPYLYVGSSGQISRYRADTGAFDGWIGQINGSPQLTGGTVPTGPYGLYVNNIPTTEATGTPNGACVNASGSQQTPGWCMGGRWGQPGNPQTGNGAMVYPLSIYADPPPGNTLYTVDMTGSATLPVIQTYYLDTGIYKGTPIVNLAMSRPYSLTTDGSSYFLADTTRVTKMDGFFNFLGWVGKLGSGSFSAGAQGCAPDGNGGLGVQTNQNTPGWCVGSTAVAKAAFDEEASFYASSVDYDGAGSIIVGQGYPGLVSAYLTNPVVKKYDAGSGAYQGALGMISTVTGWTTSLEKPQNWGMDDNSFFYPNAIYSDTTNGVLYVGDGTPVPNSALWGSARLKKIDAATGNVLGWLGAITNSPTGGAQGCVGAAPGAGMPGWCLGAYPNMPYYSGLVPTSPAADGTALAIGGIASDGVYLYTTDILQHRVQRWRVSDGAYMGWIGGVATAPTAGSCPGGVGQFSGGLSNIGGWCKGGHPVNSAAWQGTNGYMLYPSGIYTNGTYLYVYDTGNARINRYDMNGAFKGWIGRVGSSVGMTGCSTVAKTAAGWGTVYETSNWCYGGQSYPSGQPWFGSNFVDPGGGFGPWYFWGGGTMAYEGITGDGTNLYVTNSYNSRIDRIRASDGVYQGSISSHYDSTSSAWQMSPTNANLPYIGFVTSGVATDGTNLYWSAWTHMVKKRLSDGAKLGWRGSVSSGPLSGEPGCAGASSGNVPTPGWCTGGNPTNGMTMGRFRGDPWSGGTSVTLDGSFLYVTDAWTHRVTRLPK